LRKTPKTAASKERRTKKPGEKPPLETDAPKGDGVSRGDVASDDAVPGQNVSSKRRLKVRIAEMSARGLSPQEIASRLNLSLTEVDLALNLLQRPGN
jgi:DNA-binding NarL/FixJ family response regulator